MIQIPELLLPVVMVIIPLYFFIKMVLHAVKYVRETLQCKPGESVPVTLREMLITPIALSIGTIGLMIMNRGDTMDDLEAVARLSQEHDVTVYFFLIIAIASYIMVRKYKEKFGPVLNALAPFGLLSGIIFYLLILIQLWDLLAKGSVLWLLSIIFPPLFVLYFSLLCLFPAVIYMVGTLIASVRYNHFLIEKQASPESDFFLSFFYKIYKRGTENTILFILMWPVFLNIVQLILMFFGQKPDSYIRAFTEACSETLLGGGYCPPPPPSAHYLCTIAVHGHPHLVKPVRRGVRNGQHILVNRQLMICNAFEEWLQEKAPRIQKFLRKNYDRLEVPVNRWSRHLWLANTFYILTKPLEWGFLLCLYLFDPKPENRIQRQYLPKR